MQSRNISEEAHVSDGVVGCLGASVSIGSSKISHRREMSSFVQIAPVQYRRSSLKAALLVSKKSS